MKKVMKSGLLVPALLAGMFLAAGASAQDVTYQIMNTGGGNPTGASGYQYLDNFSATLDGTSINNALVGGISISQVGTQNSSLPANYVTICTDLNGSVYLGQSYTYQGPTGFLNPNVLTGIAPSWGAANPGVSMNNPGQAIQAMQNAAWIFYNEGGANLGSTGITSLSVDQMAGLQLAVWATLYNSTGNNAPVSLDGSRFQLSSASGNAAADAAGDIAALNAALAAGAFKDTASSINGYLLYPDPNTTQGNGDGEPVQELLVSDTFGQAIPVPEPATLISGALLLLPFGASTLRILRRQRAA